MAIGWFGQKIAEDVADWAGGAAESVVDAAGDAVDWVGGALESAWDVVDGLPVFEQLGDATKAIFKGPLRDFAKSAVGQVVLRALATTVSLGATAVLGPLGGTWSLVTAHALPGVLRGEPFEEALLQENLWRIEKAAEVVGPELAGGMAEQWGRALDEVKRRAKEVAPDLELPEFVKAWATEQGLTPEELGRSLARELGIREDMGVQAVELAIRQKLLDRRGYDLRTGAKYGAVRPSALFSTAATLRNTSKAYQLISMQRDAVRAARATSATAANTSRAFTLLREQRAAAPAAPAPARTFDRATGGAAPAARPRHSVASDLALGALVVGAVGAVVWWSRSEARR